MTWSRTAVLAVIAIFTVSYVYSSIKRTQLSNTVKEAEGEACAKKGNYNCNLIATYHNECFEQSYRAEYRIRSFHASEYHACIENKINHHSGAKREPSHLLEEKQGQIY
jgi:hypothetical protein